jgi:2,5-furandicarboxylate decarboxylase 1
MHRDLRSCIELLKSSDRLITIKKQADPRFEVPALMKAAEKAGKAVLFEKVSKPGFRIINNILSSREVLALFFETSPEKVVNEWIDRVKNPIPPEPVSSGPVKDTVRKGSDVNLNDLPIVTHCTKDAGPFITAGLVVAKDPDTGIRNVSINRMQLKGRDKLGIRMMPPQHLGLIHEKWEKRGKNLEVAVAIGVHPFELMAATTTVAYGVDEFGIAGSLRREPLKVVKCETVDLEVPAAAEIILEGEVLAGVREPEGPFGDFMQYYVPVMDNHVFKVEAMTHRRDPVYQTIQASSLEDTCLLALSREAKIHEAVSKAAEVHAISLTPTILACAISIRKRFEGEPKNVAAAAFGVYPWLKYCVVVDQDVNVFDVNDVWWAMATRSRPDKGLFLIPHAFGFPRDPFEIHQSKLGIDATAPLNQWEEFERKTVPGADLIRLEDYLLP